MAHLSPGVRGRKRACEWHLVKAKHNLRNFQGRQKVRTGSQRTLPPASFKHTSSIFPPFPLRPCHAPPFLGSSMPLLPPPFPSPTQVITLSHAAVATSVPPPPSVEGAPDHSEGRTMPAGRPLACPSHPTACGASLLQLSRDAFHPPHVHFGGRWVQERHS